MKKVINLVGFVENIIGTIYIQSSRMRLLLREHEKIWWCLFCFDKTDLEKKEC